MDPCHPALALLQAHKANLGITLSAPGETVCARIGMFVLEIRHAFPRRSALLGHRGLFGRGGVSLGVTRITPGIDSAHSDPFPFQNGQSVEFPSHSCTLGRPSVDR